RPRGTGVNANTSITLFADSTLNPSTVPSAMFVSVNGVLVPGTVSVTSGNRAILFTPSAAFAPGALVEIAVTSAVKDPSGNPLNAYFGTFFVAPDTTASAPTLVTTNPLQY